MTTPSRKEQVVNLLKSIETGDPAPIASIHPTLYIQHNLNAGDGLAGLGELLAQLPAGSARAATRRAFEDGDFVFAHSEYDFFGPKIGFDIFRFEDGKIVEHWDNLQETPGAANPSGRTMIDGPVETEDLGQTEVNKSIVRAFVDDVLVHGRMEKLADYFDGDNYAQHNPQIGDGLSGLGKALAEMANQGVSMQYERTHMVLGEGNFVLAFSEGRFGGKHVAYCDLFRIEEGKIVEHWDTIEEIPARADWKNANGKF